MACQHECKNDAKGRLTMLGVLLNAGMALRPWSEPALRVGIYTFSHFRSSMEVTTESRVTTALLQVQRNETATANCPT